MALTFVAFFNMLLGVVLHGGPIISCSQCLSGKGPSSKVLSVDAVVNFLENVWDLVLLEAL